MRKKKFLLPLSESIPEAGMTAEAAVQKNLIISEEEVPGLFLLFTEPGENSCRGRRSAVGATEEEAGSFVGTRIGVE
jgi:hypothetical protein